LKNISALNAKKVSEAKERWKTKFFLKTFCQTHIITKDSVESNLLDTG